MKKRTAKRIIGIAFSILAIYCVCYYFKWHFLLNREHSEFDCCMRGVSTVKQSFDNVISNNGRITIDYLKSSSFCNSIEDVRFRNSKDGCYKELIQKTANLCSVNDLNSPGDANAVTINLIQDTKYEIKTVPGLAFRGTCNVCVTEKSELQQGNTFSKFKKFILDCNKGKSQECVH